MSVQIIMAGVALQQLVQIYLEISLVRAMSAIQELHQIAQVDILTSRLFVAVWCNTLNLYVVIFIKQIVDIDECAVNNGGCGRVIAATCTNAAGTYNCTCNTGFEGTSPNCTGNCYIVIYNIDKK